MNILSSFRSSSERPPIPRPKQPPPLPRPASPVPRASGPLNPPPLPMHSAPARTVVTAHQQFAEEAARAAQRYLDQVDQIEALVDERDAWQRRALLAEGEIHRLEKRETELLVQIDHKTQQVMVERDAYRQTITVVGAQYNAASKILLDGFAAIAALEAKLNHAPDAKAGTEATAKHDDPVDEFAPHPHEPQRPADLHDEIPPDPPLPASVRAGPNYDDE